ncbi:hypothetical protein ES705_22388 [subsurface metagenome]
MPQFLPGESKTAIAPITIKPAGLGSEAELYLGPDELTKVATSGRIPFVSTGASQSVRLPVTMPDVEGTYHVYIDVHVQDILVGAFQAIEDVIIEAPPALPFTFSGVWVQRVRCESATAWNTLNFGCTITNPTDRSITHTLTPMYRSEGKYGYSDPRACSEGVFTLTLKPGQSYNCNIQGNYYDAEDRRWRCAVLLGFSAGVPYGGCAFLRDENGNDSPQRCV